MELIDIGVNLTNKRLRFKTATILEEARQNNVSHLIVTGTSLEHSRIAIELCGSFPDQLLCTAGVHPHDAKEWNEQSPEELTRLIEQPSVRAVGECGLDFNRNYSARDEQIDVFQQQLDIASKVQKPVFLHQRDAMDTFLSLLKEYRDQLNSVVVHCFTDDKRALYQLLDLDCHIGITGWICDERRGQELQSSVKDIPADRLMLETDAPYLLPRNLPQKPPNNTNYPKYLPHILNTVALHQGKDTESLATEVLLTTQRFFKL